MHGLRRIIPAEAMCAFLRNYMYFEPMDGMAAGKEKIMEQLAFAENVTKLRHERGITQETLADFVGVTKASVSKWETGQSLPDIPMMLLLASYFGVTLDELLGYRPELTKKQIRSLYRELAEAFAEKPFEEVFERSQKLVKAWYSCCPFLLQISVLWLNHCERAPLERRAEVLKEIEVLCARIQGNSRDSGLCSDAVFLEAVVRLMQGKTEEVIGTLEEICNPYRMSRNSDAMLIQAYLQAGDIGNADARVQIYMYEGALAMLNGAVNFLAVHLQEPDKCRLLLARTDAMLAQGGLERLHPNAAAQYEYQAAIALCAQGNYQEGAARLRHFADLVNRMKQNGMRLQGDELLDRLEEWFEKNELGAEPVRCEASVTKSAAQALQNPVFSGLPQEELVQIQSELLRDGSEEDNSGKAVESE